MRFLPLFSPNFHTSQSAPPPLKYTTQHLPPSADPPIPLITLEEEYINLAAEEEGPGGQGASFTASKA